MFVSGYLKEPPYTMYSHTVTATYHVYVFCNCMTVMPEEECMSQWLQFHVIVLAIPLPFWFLLPGVGNREYCT